MRASLGIGVGMQFIIGIALMFAVIWFYLNVWPKR